MKKEVTLYKRKNSLVRLLGLLIAGISFFTTIIFVVDNIYNNQKTELDVIVFSIILIILGTFIYKFTGYTKEILVFYNEKGFNIKDMGFIEWNKLKTWTLKTKEKDDSNPFIRERNRELSKTLPFPIDLLISIYPKIRKNTLKLELVDNKIISFSDDETDDILKFIIFLRKNFKNKQKGKFKWW